MLVVHAVQELRGVDARAQFGVRSWQSRLGNLARLFRRRPATAAETSFSAPGVIEQI